MTENPSDIFSSRSCPNLEDHLFCTKIKFYRFSRMKKTKQSNQIWKIHKNRKVPPVSPLAARPCHNLRLKLDKYRIFHSAGIWSVFSERRTRKIDVHSSIQFPPSQDDEDTFSARERGRFEIRIGGAGKQRSTLVCPRVSLAEGIRITIQFIHSRPFTYLLTIPTTHFSFILPLSTSTYTPSTFRGKPTTHPLSHIITRPLWKCVSLPIDSTRRSGLIPQNKQTGFGVGIHPTRYYWFTLQMPLWGASVWLLLLHSVTYYTHLIR